MIKLLHIYEGGKKYYDNKTGKACLFFMSAYSYLSTHAQLSSGKEGRGNILQ